jgi:hypothetical protein
MGVSPLRRLWPSYPNRWLRAELERRGVEPAEMRRLLGNAQQQLSTAQAQMALLAAPAPAPKSPAEMPREPCEMAGTVPEPVPGEHTAPVPRATLWDRLAAWVGLPAG